MPTKTLVPSRMTAAVLYGIEDLRIEQIDGLKVLIIGASSVGGGQRKKCGIYEFLDISRLHS